MAQDFTFQLNRTFPHRLVSINSKFHELLLGALQGARTDHVMMIWYKMLIMERLARRPKGAREICHLRLG